MATLQMGEYVSNVSNGIDTYSIREPLGVCAGICPFNFPAMIPLWVSMFQIFFSFRSFHSIEVHFSNLSIILSLFELDCLILDLYLA